MTLDEVKSLIKSNASHYAIAYAITYLGFQIGKIAELEIQKWNYQLGTR
jgi:hypothetical protein